MNFNKTLFVALSISFFVQGCSTTSYVTGYNITASKDITLPELNEDQPSESESGTANNLAYIETVAGGTFPPLKLIGLAFVPISFLGGVIAGAVSGGDGTIADQANGVKQKAAVPSH